MTARVDRVIAPLEDRIFQIVSEMPFFTIKHIKPLFNDVSEKTLYRAVNKLESAGRINFLHWQSGQKVFTAAGVSRLPIFVARDGKKADLNLWFKHLPNMYDEQGNWRLLHNLNDMPIRFCSLFLLAQLESRAELKREWVTAVRTLTEYREQLQVFIGQIDAVLRHSIMSGDLDYFVELLTGDEAPTPKELTDFKVWLSRNFAAKEINNEGSEDTQS